MNISDLTDEQKRRAAVNVFMHIMGDELFSSLAIVLYQGFKGVRDLTEEELRDVLEAPERLGKLDQFVEAGMLDADEFHELVEAVKRNSAVMAKFHGRTESRQGTEQ